MSSHFYLFSEETGECVEAVAHVGSRSGPRIEANALQAFLLYHHKKASGKPLVMREIDAIARDSTLVSSLEEAAEDFEMVGGFGVYKKPIMIWNEANYRSLAKRLPGLAEMLTEYEHAPGGGLWVRRTVDGRII